MRVSDVLNSKGTTVVCVPPEARVSDVVGELSRRAIGAVVVSRDGRSIDGIASERDVVHALHQRGPSALEARVDELMSSPVTTCRPEDELESLMTVMTNSRIRHLPVTVDGRLAGIVSIGDVVKIRLRELEQDRDALERYITAR